MSPGSEEGGELAGEAASLQRRPLVAIVGRPNVGKSTLFNRLVGRRQAIVHDRPGVTRDRIFGRLVIEDQGELDLVDTGGLVPGDDALDLNAQVLMAVEEADLLLLLVDGRAGLVPADYEVWASLRRYDRPAVLVVNKADVKESQANYGEFYQLGVWPQVLVSAEHGTGIGDLVEEIASLVSPVSPGTRAGQADRIAIVGRPNVGKSSLLNQIIGSPRSLVSPQAGTTRDPVDTSLDLEDGSSLILVDTAGIRRRSQVTDVSEGLAVLFARRQLAQADVAVLVIDATAGITSGDLAIAGAIWESGRGVVVVCNKWDLLDDDKREELEDSWPRLEEVLHRPPRINASALTGRHVDKLFAHLAAVLERHRARCTTSHLNEILERAVARHQAPAQRGRPWNLLYSTQVSTSPPTFMLFSNRLLDRSDPYRRYLENRLREELDLDGIPIRLVIKKRG